MSDIGDDGYTINGKKFAVVMVIDVSGSMDEYVKDLSNKFNEFVNFAKEDKDITQTMDIAVLTFNNEVNDEFGGFSDINGLPHVDFEAHGSTDMAAALIKANQMARDRTHEYRRMGIEAYKPWIILMTDGYPDRGTESQMAAISEELKQRENDGKIHVFAVGMGIEFNGDVLKQITDKCFAITDWNFAEFFSWLGKSVAQVSKSTPGTQCELCDTGKECQDMMGKFFGTL